MTKCPRCGEESHGLVPLCPACGYLFAAPDTNLPAQRRATRRVEPLPGTVREQLRSGRPVRPMLAPFAAGLLVALAVVAVTWFAGQDRSGARSAPASPNGLATGAQFKPKGSSAAFTRGVERVAPAKVSVGATILSSVTDGKGESCLMLEGEARTNGIEFLFDAPVRFSHFTLDLGCAGSPDPESSVDAAVTTEDGARRVVHVPDREGMLWVDLAGAWSSKVTFTFEPGPDQDFGFAEIGFYAFSTP